MPIWSNLGPVMAGLAQGNPLGGYQALTQQRQGAMRNALLQQQMMMQMAEFQREQARRAALSDAATAMVNPLGAQLAPDALKQFKSTIEPLAQAAPEVVIEAGMSRMFPAPVGPTSRMQFLQEFLALPPEQQAAAKQAGIVGAPQTVIQMGPKLPANYQWIDPADTSKGVRKIPGVQPAQDAIRYSAIGLENERLIDDFMSQLFTPEGELDTDKFAELQIPGSTLRNMLGTISQNETYLKSGAAAAEQEAQRIAAGIAPSLMQFFKGEAEATRKQLERSKRLAGMFALDEMREQEEAVRTTPQAPAPGTVDSGYIFLGGDPADPDNWAKQR